MYNNAHHHQHLLGSHRLFAKLCQRYLVETMELYVLHGCTINSIQASLYFFLSPQIHILRARLLQARIG